MIDKVLKVIEQELKDYLKSRVKAETQPLVKLNPLLRPNGELLTNQGMLVLSLVRLEEERTNRAQSPTVRTENNRVRYREPEIVLNLYLLVSAMHDTYPTGLEYLSLAAQFFQGKPVWTRRSSPGLPEEIRRIVVDLYSLDFEQQNHLWASLGAKYVPSALYRLRVVPIQDERPSEDFPPILSVTHREGQSS
jgi:hypothetical protein